MGNPAEPNLFRRFSRNEFRELKEVLAEVVQHDKVADLSCGLTKPRRALLYQHHGTLFAVLSAKGVRPFGVSCADDRGMRWIVQAWLGGAV
jgi:hypothetical protein